MGRCRGVDMVEEGEEDSVVELLLEQGEKESEQSAYIGRARGGQKG